MYNKFLNQTNIDYDRAGAEVGGAESNNAQQPGQPISVTESSQMVKNAGAQKTLSYTMKLQVKKAGEHGSDQNNANQSVFAGASGQSSMINDNASNSHPPSGGGYSGSEKTDSRKFRRISDKCQDHQRFFKNLIELPNGGPNNNVNTNNNNQPWLQNAGNLENSAGTKSGSSAANTRVPAVANGTNSQTNSVNIPASGHNGYRPPGNPAQAYGGDNHQVSNSIYNNNSNKFQNVQGANSIQPQNGQHSYFTATRSRLSQSSQKHNQNRMAAAGVGSMIAQNYDPNQGGGAQLAMKYKNSSTLSPQQQAVQAFQNGGISGQAVNRDIYETLQKSSTALNQGDTADSQSSNVTPANQVQFQNKKGHQVYEELRMKFHQQQNQTNQNTFQKNMMASGAFGQQLNSKHGSQSFVGQQYVGSGLGTVGSVASVGPKGPGGAQQMVKYQRRMATGANANGQIINTPFEQQSSQAPMLPQLPSSSRLQERKKQMIMWSEPGQNPAGTQFSQQVPQSLLQNVAPSALNNSTTIYKSVNGPNGVQNLGATGVQGSATHGFIKGMKNTPGKGQSMVPPAIGQSPRITGNAQNLKGKGFQNPVTDVQNAYSRSQSRMQKQQEQQMFQNLQQQSQINQRMQQFNQYKNVININGQIEKGIMSNTSAPNQRSLPPAFRPQSLSQNTTQQVQKNNLVNGAAPLTTTSGGPPRPRRQWPEDDLPPPKISQNHYRHIHEQRDFTIENISMAGETDTEEYDDFKIQLEYEWQLDVEIQQMISSGDDKKDTPQIKLVEAQSSRQNRCKTESDSKNEGKNSTQDVSKPRPGSPFYRCRKIEDEERKKKRRDDQESRNLHALYGNFMRADPALGINEQDAQMLQLLLNGEDDIIRNEHRTISQKLQLLESQKNKLLHGAIPANQIPTQQGVPPGQTQAMTLAYYKQLEQLLMAQVKRLDIIKRLKQKAPVHESFKLQLTQEIREYLKNTNTLKQRINRYSGANPLFKNQMRSHLDTLFQMKSHLDPEEIINSANRNKAANGRGRANDTQEGGEENDDNDDPNSTTGVGQSADGNPAATTKSRAKAKQTGPQKLEINDKTLKLFRHFIDTSNIDKDGGKGSAAKRKDTELILSENGIPASEIKLAKILMDKPAPHCSAQSWAIYDQKTNTLLFGKMERERRECASLTKIMTAYTVFKLLERWEMNENTLVKVGEDAAGVIGTSADLLAAHQLAEYFGGILKKKAEEREEEERKEELERAKKEQERIKLEAELAAQAAAAGKTDTDDQKDRSHSASNGYLPTQDKETNAQSSSSDDTKERNLGSGAADKRQDGEAANKDNKGRINLSTENSFKKLPTTTTKKDGVPSIKKSPYVVKSSQFRNYPEVLYFLEEMNKNAEELGLKNSFYDSPHGLGNYQNKSSALDIAKLSTAAMQIPRFKEVVSTKFYTVKKNTNGNKRTYKWYNTHLMLGQRGINGVKTGITPAAGPCLCTSISLDGIELIVVIIATKSMDIRWPETWKLANWSMQRLRTIEKFQNSKSDKQDEIQHKRLLNRIRHL